MNGATCQPMGAAPHVLPPWASISKERIQNPSSRRKNTGVVVRSGTDSDSDALITNYSTFLNPTKGCGKVTGDPSLPLRPPCPWLCLRTSSKSEETTPRCEAVHPRHRRGHPLMCCPMATVPRSRYVPPKEPWQGQSQVP